MRIVCTLMTCETVICDVCARFQKDRKLAARNVGLWVCVCVCLCVNLVHFVWVVLGIVSA